MPDVGNLQFSYVGETSSFEKASEKVESRLKEQEKSLKKTEKKFSTFNKVVLASGVGLTALAIKKLPKVGSAFKSLSKGTGVLFGSLDKILVATKGFIGPFTKIGTTVSGAVLGFEGAAFAMNGLGVSTLGAVGGFVKLGGVLSGVAAVGLTSLISLTQQAADTLGNSLLSRTQEYLEVGARLETQTFALGLSIDSYRKATGDASVTTASMVKLLTKLGRTTGLTRGELKGGLTQMLNLSRATGLTSKQIEKLVQRAAEMSVALGVDFNEAVVAIDQSFKGYNQQLLNFGIRVNDATLAQTKFVKSQDRTVDTLSSSSVALAKFELIMSQSSTTAGVLAKANNTINGSALNAELAVKEFGNRMGEVTEQLLGPFVIKMNQLRAAFFDLKGKGGIAKAVVLLTVFGGILFKGVALILKWGAAFVIAQAILALFTLTLRSSSKIIGFFSGILRFLEKMLRAASAAMLELSVATGNYAAVATFASLASKGLGFAASGIGGAANLAGKAAEGATKKFAAFGFSFGVITKVLKFFLGVLGNLALTLALWTSAVALAGIVLLSLVGIAKSVAKAVLRMFGTDATKAIKVFKEALDFVTEAMKRFVQDIINLPERIILAFEFITNRVALNVLKSLQSIKAFVFDVSEEIAEFEEENAKIVARLRELNGTPEEEKKPEDRRFQDERSLARLKEEIQINAIEGVNKQLFLTKKVAFFNKKIDDIKEDIRIIENPSLAVAARIVSLDERRVKIQKNIKSLAEQNRAIQEKANGGIRKKIALEKELIRASEVFAGPAFRGPTQDKALADIEAAKSRLSILKVASKELSGEVELNKELVTVIKELGQANEELAKGPLVTDEKQAERTRLQKDLERLKEDRGFTESTRARLAFDVVNAKELEVKLQERGLKLAKEEVSNRFRLLDAEKLNLIDRETKFLKARKFEEESAEKAGGLGPERVEALDKRSREIQRERVALFGQERQLQRELITELGPLNQKFQEQRSADLRTRLDELAKAGASATELAKVQTEAARQNQREVWQAVSEQSNNALQSLEAKMLLYFDDTRTVAQKTSEFMFTAFVSLDQISTSVIKDIATGVSSLNSGFKNFRRAIVDLVISSLVELGIQQAKTFLIQESGFGRLLSNVEKEGLQVDILALKYGNLSKAKFKASKSGRFFGVAKASGVSGVLGSGGIAAGALEAFRTPISKSDPNAFPGSNFAPKAKNGTDFFDSLSKSLSSVFKAGVSGIGDLFSSGSASKVVPTSDTRKVPSNVKLNKGETSNTGTLSDALGAAGFGAAGGGALGSAIGGDAGATGGALLGAVGAAVGSYYGTFGAIAGGAAGGIIGGLFGRKQKKRRKAQLIAAQEAVKEILEVSKALTLGGKTLETALVTVNSKINQNTKKAKKAWEDYRDQLIFQKDQLVRQLQDASKDIKVQIKILGTAFNFRTVTAQVAGFQKVLDDALKKITQVRSDKTIGLIADAKAIFEGSILVLIESLDKAIEAQEKSFSKGARNDIGELISLTARANLDLDKLAKDRIKVNKDFNKSLLDIENEGIAQRQKTIKQDKEERIKELTKTNTEQNLNFDNQKSTTEIVRDEQIALNTKNTNILEGQKQVVVDKAAGEGFLVPGTTPTPGAVAAPVAELGPDGQINGQRPSIGAADAATAKNQNPILSSIVDPVTGLETFGQFINTNNPEAVISTSEQAIIASNEVADLGKKQVLTRRILEDLRALSRTPRSVVLNSNEINTLLHEATAAGLLPDATRFFIFNRGFGPEFGQIFQDSIATFGRRIEDINAVPRTNLGSTLPLKAKGGEITKTEPVLIHKGEFVVQEQFAQRMLPLLQSMNRGQVPVIRSGGSSRGSGGADLSIHVNVGSVDSSSRVQEIENVITRLQRRQLNNVRQMVNV